MSAAAQRGLPDSLRGRDASPPVTGQPVTDHAPLLPSAMAAVLVQFGNDHDGVPSGRRRSTSGAGGSQRDGEGVDLDAGAARAAAQRAGADQDPDLRRGHLAAALRRASATSWSSPPPRPCARRCPGGCKSRPTAQSGGLGDAHRKERHGQRRLHRPALLRRDRQRMPQCGARHPARRAAAAGGAVIGVVELADRYDGQPFDEDDVTAVEDLVAKAGRADPTACRDDGAAVRSLLASAAAAVPSQGAALMLFDADGREPSLLRLAPAASRASSTACACAPTRHRRLGGAPPPAGPPRRRQPRPTVRSAVDRRRKFHPKRACCACR